MARGARPDGSIDVLSLGREATGTGLFANSAVAAGEAARAAYDRAQRTGAVTVSDRGVNIDPRRNDQGPWDDAWGIGSMPGPLQNFRDPLFGIATDPLDRREQSRNIPSAVRGITPETPTPLLGPALNDPLYDDYLHNFDYVPGGYTTKISGAQAERMASRDIPLGRGEVFRGNTDFYGNPLPNVWPGDKAYRPGGVINEATWGRPDRNPFVNEQIRDWYSNTSVNYGPYPNTGPYADITRGIYEPPAEMNRTGVTPSFIGAPSATSWGSQLAGVDMLGGTMRGQPASLDYSAPGRNQGVVPDVTTADFWSEDYQATLNEVSGRPAREYPTEAKPEAISRLDRFFSSPAKADVLPATGMIAPGNINLNDRPSVRNPDGSISTVRSMSANIDGVETLLSTVSKDGRILSDDEAIREYERTGQHLGKFETPAAATAYAEQLHRDQERQYAQPTSFSRANVGGAVTSERPGVTDRALDITDPAFWDAPLDPAVPTTTLGTLGYGALELGMNARDAVKDFFNTGLTPNPVFDDRVVDSRSLSTDDRGMGSAVEEAPGTGQRSDTRATNPDGTPAERIGDQGAPLGPVGQTLSDVGDAIGTGLGTAYTTARDLIESWTGQPAPAPAPSMTTGPVRGDRVTSSAPTGYGGPSLGERDDLAAAYAELNNAREALHNATRNFSASSARGGLTQTAPATGIAPTFTSSQFAPGAFRGLVEVAPAAMNAKAAADLKAQQNRVARAEKNLQSIKATVNKPAPRPVIAPMSMTVRPSSFVAAPAAVDYRSANKENTKATGGFTSMGGAWVDTTQGTWNHGGGYGFIDKNGNYFAAGGDFHPDGMANYNDQRSGNWSPTLYDPAYEAGYQSAQSSGVFGGQDGGGGYSSDNSGGFSEGWGGSAEADRQNSGDTYR